MKLFIFCLIAAALVAGSWWFARLAPSPGAPPPARSPISRSVLPIPFRPTSFGDFVHGAPSLESKVHEHFTLLASRFWEPETLGAAEISEAESFGLLWDPDLVFAFLPKDLRLEIMKLRVDLAKAEQNFVKDGKVTGEDLNRWLETQSNYNQSLDSVLGSLRSDYDLRESDEAHAIRSLQALGLGLSSAEFVNAVEIEISANRALNQANPNVDEVTSQKNKNREVLLGFEMAQRMAMFEDPDWQALDNLRTETGLWFEEEAALCSINNEYQKRLGSLFQMAAPSSKRFDDLQAINREYRKVAEDTLSTSRLDRLAQLTHNPMAFLLETP